MTQPDPSAPPARPRIVTPLLIGCAIAGILALGLVALKPRPLAGPADSKAPETSAAAPTIPADVLARLGRGIDDVALTDTAGESVAWGALRGTPRAVFFGFTRCPEICPSTMAALQAGRDQAGAAGAAVTIDFVSIDPARDTPAALKEYFASFGPGVRALTGSDEAIGKVAKSFRASYRRSDLEGGDYTMDHTTLVYLLDAEGVVVDVVAYGAPVGRIADQFKALAARKAVDG